MSDQNHDHGNGHDHHSDGHKDAHGHEPSLGYVAAVSVILGSFFLWTRSWPNDGPTIGGLFAAVIFIVLLIVPFLDKGDHGHH